MTIDELIAELQAISHRGEGLREVVIQHNEGESKIDHLEFCLTNVAIHPKDVLSFA